MVDKIEDVNNPIVEPEVPESDTQAMNILGNTLQDKGDVTDILGGFKLDPNVIAKSSSVFGMPLGGTGKGVLAALAGLSGGIRESKSRDVKDEMAQTKLDAAKAKIELANQKNLFDRANKDKNFALKYFGSENKLKNDFDRKYSAAFNDITAKTEQTLKALTNASGSDNVIAIMNFMKALDPGSVVRESEFRLIPEMSGLINKIQGEYKKNVEGEGTLTPEVRRQMARSIGQLYDVYREHFIKQQDEYGRLGGVLAEAVGKKDTYNPQNVIGGVEKILDADFYSPDKLKFEEETDTETPKESTGLKRIEEIKAKRKK